MMRKWIVSIMTCALVFTFCACGYIDGHGHGVTLHSCNRMDEFYIMVDQMEQDMRSFLEENRSLLEECAVVLREAEEGDFDYWGHQFIEQNAPLPDALIRYNAIEGQRPVYCRWEDDSKHVEDTGADGILILEAEYSDGINWAWATLYYAEPENWWQKSEFLSYYAVDEHWVLAVSYGE